MRRLFYMLIFWCMVGLLLLYAIAQAQVVGQNAMSIAFAPVTSDTYGNPLTGVTYNVYQGGFGSNKTLAQSGLSTPSVSLSGLPTGLVCIQISAVSSLGVEGARSPNVCKNFASNPTPPPTGIPLAPPAPSITS